MKYLKTFSKLAFLALSAFMLSSFSPSLDGRAVVVDEGVMPSGLFAKTVGYLPGDVISVSNVAGNKTIDILVIGALDPSEGVAIMLTPEAAKACGIEKDSNSIVKITKRNGQDDRVYGNAVIMSDNPAAQEKDKPLDNPSADAVAEEVFQEENTEDVSPAEEVAEEKSDTAPAEKLEITDDKIIAETAESEEAATEVSEAAEDSDFEEVLAESSENTSEKPEEKPLAGLLPLETIEEPEVSDNEESAEDDLISSNFIYEEEEVASDIPAQPALSEENAPLPEDKVASADEEVLSDLSEEDGDSYDAIVLVPALANPPRSDSSDEVSPASPAAKEEKVSEPLEKKETSSPAFYVSYQNLMVSGPADLKPHSYYIQIATMKDDSNIQDLVNKYGNNYPITIVPLRNNSKQILIGSLNIDEYAVVLERFKSYGYKDAFLRKVK